ncbi:MAG: Crp/Fnr family transcriptional regulator [Candidatus Acetothermia bacterium]
MRPFEESSAHDKSDNDVRAVGLEYFFPQLTPDQLTNLEKSLINLEYKDGDLIFKAGSFADGLYLVLGGFLSHQRSCQQNEKKTRTFRILGPGDVFGLEIFSPATPPRRLASVTTIEESRLGLLGKRELTTFLQQNPRGFGDLLAKILEHTQLLQRRMLTSTCKTIAERIWSLFVELASRYGWKENGKLHLPQILKQSDIAQLLGVSSESVSNNIRLLEGQGRISKCEDVLTLHSSETRTVQSKGG